MGRYKYLLNKVINRLYIDVVFPLKRSEEGVIKINYGNIPYSFYLRKKTSDIPTFSDVFYTGQYNINFGFEAKTIIDCGANIGLGTIYFKNRFPNATIIAVEPESSNFRLLQKNTAAYTDIHCLQSGIWNSNTNLEITNIDSSDKWGFMTEERTTPNERTIPAISIDGLLEKYGIDTIDILKVDIEGSEKELFEKNYERWLPKVKVLILELHDHMRDGCAQSVFNALSGMHFSMYLQGENLVFFFKH